METLNEQIASRREHEAAHLMTEEEVKEVLQAIEKLKVDYGRKSLEVEAKNQVIKILMDELTQLKATSNHHHHKLSDLLASLFRVLNEMGTAFGAEMSKSSLLLSDSHSTNSYEKLTMARIFVSKMKVEVRSLVGRCETQDDLRLRITQHESKMKVYSSP